MKPFNRVKKINGKKYLYRITPYYDKKLKKNRQKSKYLGIYRGNMDTAVKRKDLHPPKSVYSYGEFIPFFSIIKELKIEEMLKEIVGDNKTKLILTIVLNKLIRPVAFQNIKSWFEGTILLKEYGNLGLSSQNMSKLLKYIGEKNIEYVFSKKLIKKISPRASLLYDLTSFSSYSKLLDLLEYGYNRDKQGLPQFNLSLVVDKNSGIPLFYDIYPGSITDVTALDNTLEKLNSLGIKEPLMILDRGFFSKYNLIKMIENSTKFIIGATKQLKAMIDVFEDNYVDIENIKYMKKYKKDILFVKKIEVKLINKERDKTSKKTIEKTYTTEGYMYYDPKRAKEESLTLLSILYSKLEELKAVDLTKVKDSEKKFKNIVGNYSKLIKKKIVNNKFEAEFIQEEVDKKIKQLGKYILLTNSKLEWDLVLSYYKGKDLAEKGFLIIKQYFGSLPSNFRTEATLKGLVFVFFISLILEMKLIQMLKNTGLNKKYSVQGLIVELHKIRKIELSNDTCLISELTKKHKEILGKLKLCA